MSPEDTVALEVVTAKLLGHDSKQWDTPMPSAYGSDATAWYVMRKDSHIEYFDTEQQALRFKRTGVRP